MRRVKETYQLILAWPSEWRYYPPSFYGWAYSPWGTPVVYTEWGWAGAPWYGVYGATFAPYPDYSGAVQWLTDYMIAANLQKAYAAQVEAQVAAVADPYASPLSPDVKQMILNEVRQDLALENSEAQQNAQGQEIDPASSSIARTLADPQSHVFVAGGDLDLVTVSGQSCPVSEGDVLEVMQEPPDSATTATATVLFAKGVNECTRGVSVEVELADLQEMQNHLRATIDEGLGEMKAKAGSSGISAPPAPARMAPVKPAFAAIAPPPDPNAATEIQEADAQAGQAEQDVSGRAGGSGGPSAPPDPVPAQPLPSQPASAQLASANQSMPSRGQTKEEVTAAFGEPAQVAPVSGGMEVDLYKGFEAIFLGGKVVAVVPMPIGSAPQ